MYRASMWLLFTIVGLVWLPSSGFAQPAPPCRIMPKGLIGERWAMLDGKAGPLGCPTGPETTDPGSPNIRQPFDGGEAVFSPGQGARMVLAAYQQDDNIIVNWGDTAPFDYDKFIVHWDRDGTNVGQADVAEYISRRDGFFRIQAPKPGKYSISVEGCRTSVTGSDCPQKWAGAAKVAYKLPPLPAYPGCLRRPAAFGLIGERWAQLGGGEGPLGCPIEREHPVPGRLGAAQTFDRGQIVFSPQQGETMVLAVYLDGGEIVAQWGDTDPFDYDKFIIRVDKDGNNISQDDFGGGRGGRWTRPANDPGRFTIFVEGCHTGGGSDCPESWILPATVTVPPPGSSAPPNRDCPIQPIGLIADRWLQLGAKTGPLGCPTAPEHDVPGRRGRATPFEHGEIVWSPDQGDRMVVSAYQDGGGIVVRWGDTGPTYNRFLVHADYGGGGNVGQADVNVEDAKSGSYLIRHFRNEDDADSPDLRSGTGRYVIAVKGCNKRIPPLGTNCDDWAIPVTVPYRAAAGLPDLSSIPTPRSVQDALRDKPKRGLLALQFMSSQPLDGDWGDDQTVRAIAMLQLAADAASRGENVALLRRPRQRFGFVPEINNELRRQVVWGKSGTSSDKFGCKRTGEYDSALKGYIPIWYRYKALLAPDVRYRMLRLLNKTGPHDPEDSGFGCWTAVVPETENHLWMIESSRYLTNQILAAMSPDPTFDNHLNGLNQYILNELKQHLKKDFIEYNARSYARWSWAGIQNLADFAGNLEVKDTAKAVLDYLAFKAAVSSNDGRRNSPYRRRVSNNTTDLFHPLSDRIKKRMLVYTGPTLAMGELSPPNRAEAFADLEMALEAVTSYQPPDLVLDLMVNPARRSYYQRFNHHTTEVYAAEPDFLLSAGGLPAPTAYPLTVWGGSDEDLGVAQATVLIPTGQYTSVNQMIHFAGRPADEKDGIGICVAPGFACGPQPVVPASYTAIPGCSIVDGPWTFIDFSSDACRDAAHREFGFYAAVHGAGQGFGFLEAVPKARLAAVTLRQFADATLSRNRARPFSEGGENSYQAWGGNVVRFNPHAPQPIVATGLPAIDPLLGGDHARLAEGTIGNSDPVTGLILLNAVLAAHGATAPGPTPGTRSAREVLALMRSANLRNSVGDTTLLQWMQEDNAYYRRLSEASLVLIGARRLTGAGADIDKVNFFYLRQLGLRDEAQLPTDHAIDRRALEHALLLAYRDKTGARASSFAEIVR